MSAGSCSERWIAPSGDPRKMGGTFRSIPFVLLHLSALHRFPRNHWVLLMKAAVRRRTGLLVFFSRLRRRACHQATMLR